MNIFFELLICLQTFTAKMLVGCKMYLLEKALEFGFKAEIC